METSSHPDNSQNSNRRPNHSINLSRNQFSAFFCQRLLSTRGKWASTRRVVSSVSPRVVVMFFVRLIPKSYCRENALICQKHLPPSGGTDYQRKYRRHSLQLIFSIRQMSTSSRVSYIWASGWCHQSRHLVLGVAMDGCSHL